MKQLSARQFRVQFPSLTEPVSVLRRSDDGFDVLGTWFPGGPHLSAGAAAVLERVSSGFGHSSPAPKPKR